MLEIKIRLLFLVFGNLSGFHLGTWPFFTWELGRFLRCRDTILYIILQRLPLIMLEEEIIRITACIVQHDCVQMTTNLPLGTLGSLVISQYVIPSGSSLVPSNWYLKSSPFCSECAILIAFSFYCYSWILLNFKH